MLSMQNNIKSASIASSKIYAFSFCAISLWIFANRIHCRPSLRQDRLIWPTFGQRCGFISAEKIDRFVTMDASQEEAAKDLGLPVA